MAKKTEDAEKTAAPAEPELVHHWSAQCVRCHRVGNMKAKALPQEGLVCEGCLSKPAPEAPAEPAKG